MLLNTAKAMPLLEEKNVVIKGEIFTQLSSH